MNDITDLSAKRAEKDCSKWTPRDALNDMIRQIDSGDLDVKALVIVGIAENKTNGLTFVCESQAKVSYSEKIALLNVALKKSVDDWLT